MAEIVANLPIEANLVPKKKRGKSRKALKPKDPSSNEANILAGKISSSPQSDLLDVAGKENQDALLLTSKKNKRGSKTVKDSKNSFENELEEIQKKLEQMRIEKEKTEELLKDRDEMLKMKEEELENRGKEQEKLLVELKKLQKAKEFKPTMSFPLVQSLRDKEEEKKGKNKKKKKQEKQKKPCAAYVLWCKDQWNEVKKENPNAEFKEISNILGTKWKNLSVEEKKPYEEKYQEDKEAYLQIVGKEKRENEAMSLLEEDQKQKVAMELLEQYLHFKQESDEAINKKKAKKEKDPLKPKQALSAYFLYMKERRAALVEEKQNVTEIAKITGEEWKNMSEEQRKPYEEIAKKQKEEYTKEMELYKQKKEDEAATRQQEEEELMKIQKQEALQLLKKKEKTDNIIKKTKEKRQLNKKQKQVNVDPNKPKRPASSFLLFSKEMRKNLLQEKPDINNSTLTALISVKWKELNENEKEIWNTKAANAMNAYKKELQEYINASEEVVEIDE
ncbi:high mobility group B protein 6-like [Thalictrum thalictroides]|uniref:High mobility group B protein 6-like n=1 Tax=Thalictrum thalictroides TaxID=46969 RepID=A0A7J6WGK1_THATH|nr:high mobility group B protein 6-like [Thalictrum thalictroides]